MAEIYHYGVKGMKWGVRQRNDAIKELAYAGGAAARHYALAKSMDSLNNKQTFNTFKTTRMLFRDDQKAKGLSSTPIKTRKAYNNFIANKNASQSRIYTNRRAAKLVSKGKTDKADKILAKFDKKLNKVNAKRLRKGKTLLDANYKIKR